MDKSIKQILQFIQDAEKLKIELRHSYTSDPKRAESVAEHTWSMSLLAILLFDHIETNVDKVKVLKMVVTHDLVEVIAGDIPAFEKSKRKDNKYKNEKAALAKLTNTLETDIQEELLNLWEEFEERKTSEAKLAQSIDKMDAIIQHNIADISTWEQGDFDINPYYKDDYFDFDKFIRRLKDTIDFQTMEKIETAGELERVSKSHLDKYEQIKK